MQYNSKYCHKNTGIIKLLTQISTITVFIMCLFLFNITTHAEEDVTLNDSVQDISSVRATVITPDVDFSSTYATEAAELDALYTKIVDIGLNTVYINTSNCGKSFYDLTINAYNGEDCLLLATQKAKAANLKCYLIFDLNNALKNVKDNFNLLNELVTELHKFVIKYSADGYLLTNFSMPQTPENYNRYMKSGSGIGYQNWLYLTAEKIFKSAADTIRLTDNSTVVGMLTEEVWANALNNKDGTNTNATFESLYDGFSDTKKYVQDRYCDFLVIGIAGAINDKNLPYEEIVNFWDKTCTPSNTPLVVLHKNDLIGTKGWENEDQMLRQIALAEKLQTYAGSAFSSYSGLIQNPLNTTAALTAYYGNIIDTTTIFEDLEMKSPTSLTFTTYEPTVEFMGTFDKNYEIKFNDSAIELNDAGYFYLKKELKAGINNFKIEHKGKVYNYKIERKVITLKGLDPSIEDGKTINLDGGTRLTISAIALKGSNVIASINGVYLQLKETISHFEEDANSAYVNFNGDYTIPNGTSGQTRDIGKIAVTASADGYSRSLYGAKVIINALPEIITSPPVTTVPTTNASTEADVSTAETLVSTGDDTLVEVTDESGSELPADTEVPPEITNAPPAVIPGNKPYIGKDIAAKIVTVNKDFTFVYNPLTTGKVIEPCFDQLPRGTVDYLKSIAGSYYITTSGKRLSKDDVTVSAGYGFGENNLAIQSVSNNGKNNYINIKLDTKISYNIEIVGNNYHTGYDGNYYLNDFTATHIFVTFDNVTSVSEIPSFENHAVFSSAKWESVTVNGAEKFRLVLALRQQGRYMGMDASYDENGLLVFNAKMFSSIQGMNIVIDPGHGYGRDSIKKFDPGAVGHIPEFDANLGVAKALEQSLLALGANPIRLKTESDYYPTLERTTVAHQYDCDLYISLHANKIEGKDEVRGTEAYYFTPFSKNLAKSVTTNVANYFQNNVYADKTNHNRGDLYSYWWVTLQRGFPSILVEMGFVSSYEDAMALADPTHQAGIASAISTGIIQYLTT